MVWTTITLGAAWLAVGLAIAAIVRRLGYHARTWCVVGGLTGPFALVIWAARRSSGHRDLEVVQQGWPPKGDIDLLVLPMRGPTPEIVRALTELRGARRRVVIARVVPHDAPRRERLRCRAHLVGDRDALGLPSAELVLLFGAPAVAVATYAATAKVALALVDSDGSNLPARIASVRIITPADVPPAERRHSVKVLSSTVPVARVVPLSLRDRGLDRSCGRAPGG